MPIDFLEDNNAPMGRDFLQEHEPESMGTSIAWAAPRIGKDLYQGAYNAFQKLPEYAQAARTEIPGMLNPLNFHPIDRSKQVLAGLTELGHGLINKPHDISEYAANRLNLLPKEWANKVPFQEDISEDINNLFGSPQHPGDSLARGLVRNSLNIIPAARASMALNPLNLSPKNIAKDILKTGEENKNTYGSLYKNLWKDAESKGFGDSLYGVNLDIPILKKFSPGKSIKGVLDFNNNPTLQNAHAAKSDLLRLQRDLTKLPTLRSAERQQLKAVTEGIDSIQSNMFKSPAGKIDQNMLDAYKKIQQGYANEVIPYKNRNIGKFKRNEMSAKELVNALSKGEFAAKRGSFHPQIGIRNYVKQHPYLSGAGAGSIGTLLYKEIFGSDQSTK